MMLHRDFVFGEAAFVSQERGGKAAVRDLEIQLPSVALQSAPRMLQNRDFVSHRQLLMSRESSVVMRDGGAECRPGGGRARADYLVSRRGSALLQCSIVRTPVELEKLYDTFAVPAAGAPLFQAATANRNSWTEVKVTEIVEIPNRGHALTIDGGWREGADKALAFVRRLTSSY